MFHILLSKFPSNFLFNPIDFDKFIHNFHHVLRTDIREELTNALRPIDSLYEKTAVEVAYEIMSRLRRRKALKEFPPSTEIVVFPSNPIASSTHLASISNLSKRQFDAFVTPLLQQVFAKVGEVIVNSEQFPWILSKVNAKSNRKPDFFVIKDGLYSVKAEPLDDATDVRKGYRTDHSIEYHFGILEASNYVLKDCIRIVLESKLSVSDKDKSQICTYLYLLSTNDTRNMYYGGLFDNINIFLFSYQNGNVMEGIQCPWNTKNLSTIVHNFVTSNCSLLGLELACNNFKVKLLKNAWLGCGASGRVFRVVSSQYTGRESRTSISVEESALKVCVLHSVDAVKLIMSQYARHKELSGSGANVVSLIGDLFIEDLSKTVTVVAYLIKEVGTPLILENRNSVEEVLSAMLLFHQVAKKEHGDARLPNCISYKGKVIFIDIQPSSGEVHLIFFGKDFRSLISSILGKEFVFGKELDSLIDAYDPTKSDFDAISFLEKISKIVCAHKFPIPISEEGSSLELNEEKYEHMNLII